MALVVQETSTKLVLTGHDSELAKLQRHFRYRPDRYWMSDQYIRWRRHQAEIKKAYETDNIALATALEQRRVGWDGWKSPVTIRSGRAIMERGHLDDLKLALEELALPVDYSGLLPNPFAGITVDDLPDDLLAVELDTSHWQLQKPIIAAWLARGMGRCKVTVSGGKTAMFCAAAAAVKRRFPAARFLYLTPSERLVAQVYSEARRFLPDWHITQFGGSGRDDSGRDLVVCTGAILGRRFTKLQQAKWFRSFMGVLVDEAQYALSPTYCKVLQAVPAYFRFAASDTTREDHAERQLLLTGLCGPVYERLEAAALIDLDRIATPTIEVVHSAGWSGKFDHLSHEPEPNSAAWALLDGDWTAATYTGPVYELDKNGDFRLDARGEKVQVPGLHALTIDGQPYQVESRWCLLNRKYDQAIVLFKERNQLIARRAYDYHRRGWPTLVVATRTLHVMILEAFISQVVPQELVRVLYSAHSPAERDECFAWLKRTPGSVLISPLVKVGVSINELVAGIVADFVSDWEFAAQIIGRFVRKKPDGTPNEAFVTMFLDCQHRSYAVTSRKLFQKLRQIAGYKWINTEI